MLEFGSCVSTMINRLAVDCAVLMWPAANRLDDMFEETGPGSVSYTHLTLPTKA